MREIARFNIDEDRLPSAKLCCSYIFNLLFYSIQGFCIYTIIDQDVRYSLLMSYGRCDIVAISILRLRPGSG
jgi:hypothetical protein